MRSVTTKPPNTFNEPNITANIPNTKLRLKPVMGVCPRSMIPPIIITPLIALAPDIKGVWSTEGTLEITSTPRNIERVMINITSLF